MAMKAIFFLIAVICTSSTLGNAAVQRFQAEKFLDMLARTFDEKIAFIDLFDALQKRLGFDPASQQNGTSTPTDAMAPVAPAAVVPINVNCPNAPPKIGATIAYTSNSHMMGSRAFYECNPGFSGRSLFIQCMSGGVWSSAGAWSGCTPVDCGAYPQVANADAAVTSTTFKSVIYYTCRPGYNMDSTGSNVTCLSSGKWENPLFQCNQIPQANTGGVNMQMLSSMLAALGGANQQGQGSNPNPMLAFMQGMAGMTGAGGAANGMPSMGGGTPQATPPANSNVMSMLSQMFQGMAPTPPPTTTTTPAPKPATPSFGGYGTSGGFQLPNHLMSLLPNGLSNTQGFSMGSATNAGPRDIASMLGSMNPMAAMMGPGGMGMGGGRGRRGPVDPELAAEQREEMMMRHAMASAMKSMMGGAQQTRSNNGTAPARNPAMDMMTMMALQNGLGGGGGGGGAGSGMDMLSMMGGMGGMPFGPMMGMGGAGNLFSGAFGGAK